MISASGPRCLLKPHLDLMKCAFARIARGVERQDGVAHPRRVLDVDPVGHVVLVKTVLHPPPLGAADYSLPKGGNQGKTGQKEKWEQADKPGSVAPAGVTRWGRQPFLSTPGYPGALATYPQARPSRPEVRFAHCVILFRTIYYNYFLL